MERWEVCELGRWEGVCVGGGKGGGQLDGKVGMVGG